MNAAVGFAYVGIIILFALAGLGVPVLMAAIVYRDAKTRGMDPMLWALVAALAPSFIGLIVYLVVRSQNRALACPSCGETVKESYLTCPVCGARLKPTCPACGQNVEGNWRLCAHCGAQLPQDAAPFATPIEAKSNKGLWALLICIIAIPAVLVVVALLGFLITNRMVVG